MIDSPSTASTDDMASASVALVVTTIHAPGVAMNALENGCRQQGWRMVIAGDGKTPEGFSLGSATYLSLARQKAGDFALGRALPAGTYARKNIGYLEAMRGGAGVIVETDDDNHPSEGFWGKRIMEYDYRLVGHDGWVNAYAYFSDTFIYPRGLPLQHARDGVPVPGPMVRGRAPIQQGLADQDPDVDAVYRMLFPLPLDFLPGKDAVLLGPGAWCPFNSQNTTFFPDAFPLLYLPTHCSFRMTDIWRSFVAQRILHAKGLGVLFHGPTVWQERNVHDLGRDFADEIPGYLHNLAMREALIGLDLGAGESTLQMFERCYETLMSRGWVGAEEEGLIAAWTSDLRALGY